MDIPIRTVVPRAALAALACLVPAVTLAAPPAAAKATEEVAVVTTPFGEIVWRFLPEVAPQHVAYVKELIGRGFYDGTAFHRVIPSYVVQGGDPNSKNADRADDGDGEGDRRVRAEFTTALHYRPGTVGMARDTDPDSGSCQFFVALVDIPRLDGKYTIFGEVIEGLDVAQRIAAVPRDLNDNPLRPVRVTVRLARRAVPAVLASRGEASSGERLTGPARPRFFDPGDVRWTAPVLASSAAPGPGAPRLELAIDEGGRVIDVRFPGIDTPEADLWQRRALSWTFSPATYGGVPQRARFEIDPSTGKVFASHGVGAPLEAGPDVTMPASALRVDLSAGQAEPAHPPGVRLTIAPDGSVAEASLQGSTGDAGLDAAVVSAAKRLLFTPATRRTYRGDAENIAAWLTVPVRFVRP